MVTFIVKMQFTTLFLILNIYNQHRITNTMHALIKPQYLTAMSLSLLCHTSWAEPVWHCSRSAIQIADISDDFTLASLSQNREVIRIALQDLTTVYQNKTVKMSGGLALSACIIEGAPTNLSQTAMTSIGLQNMAAETHTQANPIHKKQVFAVNSEQDMLACIAKHHPAVGYLSSAIHAENAGPCF